jgi:hypothetical protein
VWRTPDQLASCSRAGEVPHTDGRCTRRPCGITGAKSLEDLVRGYADSPGRAAIGRMELTGKVVEHERGYRGACARVNGLVLISTSRFAVAEDHAAISSAMADPVSYFDRFGRVRNRSDLLSLVTAHIV